MEETKFDEEKAKAYAKEAHRRFLAGDESLSKEEKRLLSKFVEARDVATQAQNSVNILQNQIQQAQARINSLNLQAANENARADGVIESLVALKFDDDLPPVEMPKKPESKTKGNGKEDPYAGNRKARRKAKVKKAKKKVKTQPTA